MTAPAIGSVWIVPRAHWYTARNAPLDNLSGACFFARDVSATVAGVSDYGRLGVRVLLQAGPSGVRGMFAWANADALVPPLVTP